MQGNSILSTNLLSEEDVEHTRYAGGESTKIVAHYVEPVISRDVNTNPLFYGFFYSYNVSSSLRLISQKYLSASYDSVVEFTNWLDKIMYESNITDPFAYYQKPCNLTAIKIFFTML
jgi:hypothetical protein